MAAFMDASPCLVVLLAVSVAPRPGNTARGAEGDRVERGTGRDSQVASGLRSVDGVTAKDDLRDFLATRRAKITPQQAGLPVYGANRRVTGLRREEVALLAGISVEYYTRLERGNVGGVSDSVLDGLVPRPPARRRRTRPPAPARPRGRRRAVPPAARPRSSGSGPPCTHPRPDADTGLPAQRPLRHPRRQRPRPRPLQPPLRGHADAPNTARFVFLDPAAPEFFLDFDKIQDDAVAYLRAEAGRDPYDKDLPDLIGELSTRSERFRQRWAAHDVRYHRTGAKRLHHPLVGDLTLDYEALELPGDQGQRLNIYTAPPHTPAAEALALLASWTLPQPTSQAESTSPPGNDQ